MNMKFRYKLKGRVRWCLNWKFGWTSIDRWIIRWNTPYVLDHKQSYILFSISKAKLRGETS